MIYITILAATVTGMYYLAYHNKVYPGIYVGGMHIGNRTKEEVEGYFKEKNKKIDATRIIFNWNGRRWEISGREAGLNYDAKKIANQTFAIGREGNIFINTILLANIFFRPIHLAENYNFSEEKITSNLKNIAREIDTAPIEGLYEYQNGRITAFKPSYSGRAVNITGAKELLKKSLQTTTPILTLELPVMTVKPKIDTGEIDKLGIKDLIGKGESYFFDSIPSRIYNIKLGASKFHGLLISPNEVFSFNQNIGTVSAYTGFKQAYVIEKGKTVLGDGGGVCQVSTTLFRATLAAGLPIIERVPHAYRVGYYEYKSPIGFDASVYDPKPDFRFKNDTGHHILIQTNYDEENMKLTFELYGTSDGRVATMSSPVFVSQAPAPTPVYQDDPTLPKGTEKQVDTAHAGAKVYFTRTISKPGTEPITETIWSNYQPWAAVILRGTKE